LHRIIYDFAVLNGILAFTSKPLTTGVPSVSGIYLSLGDSSSFSSLSCPVILSHSDFSDSTIAIGLDSSLIPTVSSLSSLSLTLYPSLSISLRRSSLTENYSTSSFI